MFLFAVVLNNRTKHLILWLLKVTTGLLIRQVLYTFWLFISSNCKILILLSCFLWTLAGAIPKLSTLQISHNRLSTADDLKHLAECHYLRYMMIIVSNNKFFQKIFIVMVCVEGCLIWNHYLRRGLWLIISALTREHVTERTSEIKTSLEV